MPRRPHGPGAPVRGAGLAAPGQQAGFTLIEAVLVIAITGVLFAVVAQFIVPPVRAYLAHAARAEMADNADAALRRIGRELRSALPGSVRVSGSALALEFIPVTAGARYATAGAGALDFGSTDTAFDVVGPPLSLQAGQPLVFFNVGEGVEGADAYAPSTTAGEQALSNRRLATNGAGPAGSVTLASLAPLPVGASVPPHRVLAVDEPVSFRCDPATGRLWRHGGYGFVATQPDPPAGGRSAVLATGVAGCRFSVDGSLVAARAALVSLRLTLATAAGATGPAAESVTLHHAVYVDNLP